jgi:hypothetical protein
MDLGRLHISGIVAWLLWLLVHIFYLIGFRNRVLVMAQWAWVYLRNERGARLITGDVEPLLERGLRPRHHLSVNDPVAPSANLTRGAALVPPE